MNFDYKSGSIGLVFLMIVLFSNLIKSDYYLLIMIPSGILTGFFISKAVEGKK